MPPGLAAKARNEEGSPVAALLRPFFAPFANPAVLLPVSATGAGRPSVFVFEGRFRRAAFTKDGAYIHSTPYGAWFRWWTGLLGVICACLIRPGPEITGSAESRSWSRSKAATFPTRPYGWPVFHVGLIGRCVRIPTSSPKKGPSKRSIKTRSETTETTHHPSDMARPGGAR